MGCTLTGGIGAQLYSSPAFRSIDSVAPPSHRFIVSKKLHNAKEGTDKAGQTPVAGDPKATLSVPSEWRPRYVDDATFERTVEKVFKTHRNVLRRLAEYDRGETR